MCCSNRCRPRIRRSGNSSGGQPRRQNSPTGPFTRTTIAPLKPGVGKEADVTSCVCPKHRKTSATMGETVELATDELLVPTLRVGTQDRTLCVPNRIVEQRYYQSMYRDAERRKHAFPRGAWEGGNTITTAAFPGRRWRGRLAGSYRPLESHQPANASSTAIWQFSLPPYRGKLGGRP